MNEAQLRARIEVLEEENRQLRQQLVPAIAVPSDWRLTPMETRLPLALRAASPNIVSRERAMLALYGFDDAPEAKILDQFLCRLRGRLADLRLSVLVENVYGRGWRLSHESARAFDDALSQREVA